MSYWAWLARMAFFGLVGSGSLWFFLSTTSQSPQPEGNLPEGQLSASVQRVAPDSEYFLPSEMLSSQGYQPTVGDGGLPRMPASRLDPLLNYDEYEAIAQDSNPSNAQTTAATTEESATSTQPPETALPPQPSQEDSASYQEEESSTASASSPSEEFNLNESLMRHRALFGEPTALGMLAIGVAEGNYRIFVEGRTLYVEQTPNYFGHTDPGNLSWGERVTNYGPCSDQGRSGGNIPLAEDLCLKRALDRLPTNLQDLNAAGIDPNRNIEALINTADLYNQASPIHSRVFPKALAVAYQGGLKGIEAIAWARTASFYLNGNNNLDLENGRNRATGLLGICAREGRAVTEWDCVYQDQKRRTQAIASVLEKYIQVYSN
ncbi:hypothetical protein PN462_22400 [Spirulina sp. CS-785/01]|uniref:hypothetical protein n=1 Tax=Spirulina sp. CS-785/01 TaxID=3021716 RepID=UPI002330B614|nr:hypothetical protein [Spirulina sp. CS-785/01]MDB9315880.1 hypothetical protein [Spirulina sp. CS-785/01]